MDKLFSSIYSYFNNSFYLSIDGSLKDQLQYQLELLARVEMKHKIDVYFSSIVVRCLSCLRFILINPSMCVNSRHADAAADRMCERTYVCGITAFVSRRPDN